MSFDHLRVSVGRTFRFVTEDEGTSTALLDYAGYRRELGKVQGKNRGVWLGFSAAWPGRSNRFYRHLLGAADYRSTSLDLQRRCLVPFRRLRTEADTPQRASKATEIEAILHPFACTIIVHVDQVHAKSTDGAEARRLVNTILSEHTSDGPRRYLGGRGRLPPLPLDPLGRAVNALEIDQGFVVVSACSRTTDNLAAAAQLISPAVPTERRWAMREPGSGLALDDGVVGLAVRWQRAEGAGECLHRNSCTLLAYMQNLSTIANLAPSDVEQFLRTMTELSGTVIEHLVKRQDLPSSGIYKSRLAEVWAGHRHLIPSTAG